MAENNVEQKKEKLKEVHERSLDMVKETLLEPLSPSKDAAKKMKYYERMNEEIKGKFSLDNNVIDHGVLDLLHGGDTGSGPDIGTKWHSRLQAYLVKYVSDNTSNNSNETAKGGVAKDGVAKGGVAKGGVAKGGVAKGGVAKGGVAEDVVAKGVVDKIEEKFVGFKFIQGELCLSGYMVNKISQSDISPWTGRTDAIGTCGGRYVIVDWKVVEVLNFWKKDPQAYGLYLHQCLVYARLLQLHLELDELPYIMIVAINNINGSQIHPRMFTDYPEECKDKFEKYTWSTKRPVSDIVPKNLLNESYTDVGEVSGNVKICDFFNGDVTVDDLQKLFGSHKFMVEEDEEDEEDEEESGSKESGSKESGSKESEQRKIKGKKVKETK